MQSSAVQHNPKVVYFNTQNLADLFALQTIDFTQRESTSGALRQRRETVVKYFPEVAALDQLRWCCVPFIWRVIIVPMTLPWIRSFKEFAVLGTFVRLFAERSLTPGPPKVIDDLVLEDPNEPGSLRTPAFKLFIRLQRCEKRLLHGVF